eukprot:TRINITY_DN15997_c0_g2_i2.p1 TRINITY_DN15997_c0_g2~~TRINITY_DN15997_c0_g2_i2.p1  ORF type:complete len:858 (-),score=88.18 TRINITY_DN15997_c0_g2_i2:246-2630(-)
MFAVDEAAYIHLWGHYFRPSFRNLWFAREEYPAVPFMTLSGAAPPALQSFIASELKLRVPLKSLGPMLRTNLYISCTRKESEKKDLDRIAEMVSKPGASSIVYVVIKARARRVARELQHRLQGRGIRVEVLTGDTPPCERSELNELFKRDEIQVMVATSAYGMGIDKPNINNIINYGPPKNMEDYYNQIGRAGRDGGSATCKLFFNNNDWKLFRESTFTHDLQEMHEADRKLEVDSRETLQRLSACNGCRWKLLLAHFGCEKEAPAAGCGACDFCRNDLDLCTGRLKSFTLPAHLLLEAIRMATLPDAAPNKDQVLQMALVGHPMHPGLPRCDSTLEVTNSSQHSAVAHLETIRAKMAKHELSKPYLSAVLDALYGHGFVKQEYVATDDFDDDEFVFKLTEVAEEALKHHKSIQLLPSRELRELALPPSLRDNSPSRLRKKPILEAIQELEAVDCDDDDAKAAAAQRIEELIKQLTSSYRSHPDLPFAELINLLTINFGRPASIEDLMVQYAQDSDSYYSCSIVVPSLGTERFTGVSTQKSLAIKLATRSAVCYVGRQSKNRVGRALSKLHDLYCNDRLETKARLSGDNTFLCEVRVHSIARTTVKGQECSNLHEAMVSAAIRACPSHGQKGLSSVHLQRLLVILTLRFERPAVKQDVQYLLHEFKDKTYSYDIKVPALNATFIGGRCRTKSDARESGLRQAIADLRGQMSTQTSRRTPLLSMLTDSLGLAATTDVEISHLELPEGYTCTIRIPALPNWEFSGKPCANKGASTVSAIHKASQVYRVGKVNKSPL